MTLKKPQCLTEQGYKNLIKLQVQYEKVVEQNRALQAELREKTAECGELKKKLKEAGHLIENALDPEKTDTDDSFKCFYKALDIINNPFHNSNLQG